MMPYIVMGVILVGMCLSAWLVLRWERQDRAKRKN
jgi:Flp pilus assembly protein TadB